MKRPEKSWLNSSQHDSNPGRTYELLKSNCQHFVRDFLRFIIDQGWMDPQRESESFKLEDMKRKLYDLELEVSSAGFAKIDDEYMKSAYGW